MPAEYEGAKNRAIAEFFEACTAILKACLPLIKAALKEQEGKLKRGVQ